ncbi:DUF2939 domain-containing protein [Candidatus Nomurabacteria bacterium]|nr:DUF2939 domain-containing protein [Candidatus Nomurabacteria bacterium]
MPRNKLFSLIIGIGVFILVAGGGYYYWWAGTPQYSLIQIKGAVDNKDVTTALSYFDTDAIFENLWTDIQAQVAESAVKDLKDNPFGALGAALGQSMLNNMKPAMKQKFSDSLKESLTNPSTATSSIATTIQGKRTIKVNGDTAIVTVENGLEMRMLKQSDRRWKIIALKGLPSIDNLMSKDTAQSSEPSNDLSKKVSLEITKKGFSDENYQTKNTLVLQLNNLTGKDIQGVKGSIVIKDLFGDAIKHIDISYDGGLKQGESKLYSIGVEYNQFMEEDIKLRQTALEKLQYDWEPSTIIYEDGTRENS